MEPGHACLSIRIRGYDDVLGPKLRCAYDITESVTLVGGTLIHKPILAYIYQLLSTKQILV